MTMPFRIGALWKQLALSPHLKRSGAEVLHSQYVLPPCPPIPSVVTIHDISFAFFPQWFPPRARRIMKVLIPLSARVAKVVLTGSQCSKRDMVRWWRIDADKIIVTPYAASAALRPMDATAARAQVQAQFGLDEPYILGIGLRGARKNLEVVLRALEIIEQRRAGSLDIALALAGTAAEFPAVAASSVANRVRFLGFVPQASLRALYAGAMVAVYPSFYEGFGFPPLEAMSCGCPVLSSDRASLPEVVGDGGQLLAPDDAEAWAQSLQTLLEEPAAREQWRERGLKQAARFSWDRAVRQTWDVYQQIAR